MFFSGSTDTLRWTFCDVCPTLQSQSGFPHLNTFEFFREYTKLAMLSIKAYMRKSKINSVKKLPLVLVRDSDAFVTELT